MFTDVSESSSAPYLRLERIFSWKAFSHRKPEPPLLSYLLVFVALSNAASLKMRNVLGSATSAALVSIHAHFNVKFLLSLSL